MNRRPNQGHVLMWLITNDIEAKNKVFEMDFTGIVEETTQEEPSLKTRDAKEIWSHDGFAGYKHGEYQGLRKKRKWGYGYELKEYEIKICRK